VAERVEESLLRSLELACVPRKRPDNLDAFRDQLRRCPELPVESVLPRSGRLQLLLETVLSFIGPVLPSRDAFEDGFDALETLFDFGLHEAQYTAAWMSSPVEAER
jgi:hypothetical protein